MKGISDFRIRRAVLVGRVGDVIYRIGHGIKRVGAAMTRYEARENVEMAKVFDREQGFEPEPKAIAHRAGAYHNHVQGCLDCDVILMDHRKAQTDSNLGGTPMRGFDTGRTIIVKGNKKYLPAPGESVKRCTSTSN